MKKRDTETSYEGYRRISFKEFWTLKKGDLIAVDADASSPPLTGTFVRFGVENSRRSSRTQVGRTRCIVSIPPSGNWEIRWKNLFIPARDRADIHELVGYDS
jgi:hypothetical protein